ncbi:hypothetical protein Sango_0547000 [Sesamum angolense]|uniref:Uncharacterized protein n=1 Tax=Sesamum angolense TaxID=2727404 RepID=A0AAE1X532_9LAMI|nr:hypothetical protein Sango_0547000 [Sesamum angolense]
MGSAAPNPFPLWDTPAAGSGWVWGWDWILSRKPTFATDLEMNEEETAVLGTHNKGSWRHVFYKVTSQLRRKLGGADNVGLPQTFRDFNYSKNSTTEGRPPSSLRYYIPRSNNIFCNANLLFDSIRFLSWVQYQ